MTFHSSRAAFDSVPFQGDFTEPLSSICRNARRILTHFLEGRLLIRSGVVSHDRVVIRYPGCYGNRGCDGVCALCHRLGYGFRVKKYILVSWLES